MVSTVLKLIGVIQFDKLFSELSQIFVVPIFILFYCNENGWEDDDDDVCFLLTVRRTILVMSCDVVDATLSLPSKLLLVK